MSGQAAQQSFASVQISGDRAAGSSVSQARASSRSIVVGVAGALATAATIAGFIMMSGSASVPANTLVASISSEQISTVAPAYVPAPAQLVAPAANFAAAPAPVAAPFAGASPVQTPQPGASDQCRIGQPEQLALQMSASNSKEVGNKVRFIVGSYVSPVFIITRSPQVVTFPVPAGSQGSAQMVVEQQNAWGATWDGVDGLDLVFGQASPDHLRSVVNLHWTPHC